MLKVKKITNSIACMAVTLLLLVASNFCQVLSAASWTTFKKDSSRTGLAGEYAGPPLTPLWYFDTQGGFFSQASIYKDTVFAGCRDGSVWAWRISDGEVVWQYSTDGWVDSTPCVWKDFVIAVSRDGNVYCFNRNSGDIVWTVATGNANVSSPMVHDNVLYFMSGSPGTEIWKLNPLNGSLLGKIQLSLYGFSSPSIENNILVVGTNDGRINIIDLASGGGSLIKTISTSGGIKFITPSIKNGRIYTSTDGDERRLYAFDTSGNIIWKTPQLSDKPLSASSVAISPEDGNGYVAIAPSSDAMLLVKFSLANGTTLWMKNIGKPSPTGKLPEPILVNDLIYQASGDGYLRILDKNGNYIEPFTGNIVATSTGVYLGGGVVAPCTISDGKLVIGTMAERLWVFECAKFLSVKYPDEYDVAVDSTVVLVRTSETGNYLMEYKKSGDSSWKNLASGTITSSGTFSSLIEFGGLSDGLYELRFTLGDAAPKKALSKFTVNNVPAAPTELIAEDTPFDGGGSITLSWQKSSDDGAGNNDVLGYKIFRSTWPGNFLQIASVAAGVVTYTDSGLLNETTFYYCLKSYDALSESAYSNIASAQALVDGKLISTETGGTVTLGLADGTTVEVILPAGWFKENGYVGIRPATKIYEEHIPSSARKTSRIYQFGARDINGTMIEKFLKPVTIKIPYLPSDIAGMNENNLRIYRYDKNKKKWGIVNNSSLDTLSKKISVEVPKFSLYGIMEYLTGKEELISFDKVYVYPNPARGGRVTFKYFVDETADVTIDVYNVAGERVARFEKNANPAGIVSEIDWDVSDIASGVYVWRIEAKSISGRKKAIKKKFAIIN